MGWNHQLAKGAGFSFLFEEDSHVDWCFLKAWKIKGWNPPKIEVDGSDDFRGVPKFDSIILRTDISITTWTGGLLQSGTWSPGMKQDWCLRTKGLGLGWCMFFFLNITGKKVEKKRFIIFQALSKRDVIHHTYVRRYVRTYVRTYVSTYFHTFPIWGVPKTVVPNNHGFSY